MFLCLVGCFAKIFYSTTSLGHYLHAREYIFHFIFSRDADEATGEEPDDADLETPKVYEPVSVVLLFVRHSPIIHTITTNDYFLARCKSVPLAMIVIMIFRVFSDTWMDPAAGSSEHVHGAIQRIYSRCSYGLGLLPGCNDQPCSGSCTWFLLYRLLSL